VFVPVTLDNALVVFAVLAGTLCASEADAQGARSEENATDGSLLGTPNPLVLGMLVCGWAAALQHVIAIPTPDLPRTVGGGGFMAGGVALYWLAVRTLGPWFQGGNQVAEDQPLVTDGIYGQMRHPAATASVLVAGGGALLLGSGIGVLLTIVVQIPLVMWQTRREDAVLAAHFADGFKAYRKEVPGLVPKPRAR
jgi:protein-S-isoprenylcysteine O-methyltransferase Ste14